MTKRKKRFPKLTEGTPIIITWIDAWQDSDEHGSADEIMKLPEQITCRDIGFYIGEGKQYITIATEKMGEASYRHTHRFPKVNIITLEVLSYEQAKTEEAN